MSKQPKPETVKVLSVFREQGAYGFREHEIPADVLEKQGKVVYSSNADIFAICVSDVTKKIRDLFGI